MRIRKGDTVIVVSGGDKGKTGEVIQIDPKLHKVTISGINIQIRHRKPSGTRKPGGREKSEYPIDVSNVSLVRPGKKTLGTRIGTTISKSGKKVRVARQAQNKEIA